MHDTPPNDRSAMHSTIDRVREMHRPQTMPIPFVVSKKAPIMSADSGMLQSAFWAMVCGIRETIENNTIYPQSFKGFKPFHYSGINDLHVKLKSLSRDFLC